MPDFVIVDEAHRLRSPHTRRYALIADLARRSQILLVTATPVHNRRDDLAAQLALFLGRVAWQLSDEELTECVVRDSGSSLGARPRLDGPHRVTLERRRRLPGAAAGAARPDSSARRIRRRRAAHLWTSASMGVESRGARRGTAPSARPWRRAHRRARIGTSAHARRACRVDARRRCAAARVSRNRSRLKRRPMATRTRCSSRSTVTMPRSRRCFALSERRRIPTTRGPRH